ncbi:glycosyl transferase [Chitinophaga sp. MD30]|nr:glycosyltransferase [Chitinophaga pendula]ASZ11292.1 glycosyl transferase [Chitinophaga sp. MD30]
MFTKYLMFQSAPLPTIVHSRPAYHATDTTGFDLILPCCNPSHGWMETLVKHYKEVTAELYPVRIQLILVNDGSVKNFEQVHIEWLRKAIPGIIIVSYTENRGKGYAIREGVKHARSRYQIYTDLDFPFGTAVIREVYDHLLAGKDIVAAERGTGYLNVLPRKRKIITRLSRAANKYLLQLKVNDAQAGLKGFNNRGKAILLSTRVDGFLYDSEFIHRAGKQKALSIVPVPVHCREGIAFSSFRFKLLWKELNNYLRIIGKSQG